jgi:hypothetical protein
MLFPSLHRHLPKSPLPKRNNRLRAELTHLATRIIALEREQQTQLTRTAQIQQELDEIKLLLKKMISRE